MLFPAAKLGDMVIGLDVHKVFIPPVPPPGPPVPHPYFGAIVLWVTPKHAVAGDVLVNGMPAACIGCQSFGAHIPMGLPGPESATNTAYWKRYLTQVAMAMVLTLLTTFANLAIAALASFIPKPKSAEGFLKEVTGIDTSSKAAVWESIKGNAASYTQWATWVKLLIPPLPYPMGQGSCSVGSPGVQCNGGAMGFVAPLVAASCTEFPFVIIPNAATLGFSNVMVGITAAQFLKALAVGAAQRGIQGAVAHGVSKLTEKTSTDGQHA
jgi:hypothetical protein